MPLFMGDEPVAVTASRSVESVEGESALESVQRRLRPGPITPALLTAA